MRHAPPKWGNLVKTVIKSFMFGPPNLFATIKSRARKTFVSVLEMFKAPGKSKKLRLTQLRLKEGHMRHLTKEEAKVRHGKCV